MRVRDLTRLMAGLGPWADGTPGPATILRELHFPTHAGPAPAWLYAPTSGRPRRAWLLSPGLHHEQAGDPRMDRFARVLAGAGALVLSPSLPDLTRLLLHPRVIDDLAAAFTALLAQPELPAGCRPAVFSISVGSLAALRLAADPRVSAVVTFGGYASPAGLLRAVTRLHHETAEPFDPLNAPLALLALAEHLPPAHDPAALTAAWTRFVRLSWPRPAMKTGGAHLPFAHELAASVHPADRERFLMGCGARPGARALVDEVLARGGADALDPRPHLGRIAGAVHVMHGRSDPTIPFSELAALDAALPAHVPRRLYATGLYSHTGATGARELLRNLPALAGEARTLLGLVGTLAQLGG